MKISWYSKSIRILAGEVKQASDALRGAHFTAPAAFPEAHYEAPFIAYTRSLLDEIVKLPLGRELVDEIDASGKRLTIAFLAKGGVACPEATDATVIHRYFKTFRKPEAKAVAHMKSNLGSLPEWQLTQPATYYTQRLSQAIGRSPYTQDALARLVIDPTLIPATYKSEYNDMVFGRKINGPPLANVSQKIRNDPKYKIRHDTAKLDIREQLLQDMIDGVAEVDDATYVKISLYLHEWLQRGDGVNAIIGYSAVPGHSCADQKADWSKGEVPFIIIAHELIHAWRMMTGRRIFLGGIGEEHITVGLPPYTSMKFTENKLRAQAKVAIRDHYQAAIHDPFSGTLAIPWTSRTGRDQFAKHWAANAGEKDVNF